MTSFCLYWDHLCNALLHTLVNSFSLPQTAALGGSREDHTHNLCWKRFMVRVSSSRCLAVSVISSSSALGLCGLYLHFSPAQPTLLLVLCRPSSHWGGDSPTPHSWGGQQHPDQDQTLAPQVPGHHRLMTKSYACRSHTATLLSRETTTATRTVPVVPYLDTTPALTHCILLLQVHEGVSYHVLL